MKVYDLIYIKEVLDTNRKAKLNKVAEINRQTNGTGIDLAIAEEERKMADEVYSRFMHAEVRI